jgi:hypothetical protein
MVCILVGGLSLPLGVHFFCVAKRNRTKEKATLIPSNRLVFGGDNMGNWVHT